NQSFIAYLTQVRIPKAISLIKTTKLTIAEISESVGYANSTYFCRVFKRVTGQTVGKIRSTGEYFSGSM
ncbi:MAG: helix-turn-helix domain-containing protein, partial [Oscillospiraceae bacterium]